MDHERKSKNQSFTQKKSLSILTLVLMQVMQAKDKTKEMDPLSTFDMENTHPKRMRAEKWMTPPNQQINLIGGKH